MALAVSAMLQQRVWTVLGRCASHPSILTLNSNTLIYHLITQLSGQPWFFTPSFFLLPQFWEGVFPPGQTRHV